MRGLRRVFLLATLVGLLLLAVGLWTISLSYLQSARLASQQQLVGEIASDGLRLALLTSEVLLQGELRAERQWRELHHGLLTDLTERHRGPAEHERQVATIVHALGDIEELFDTLLATIALARSEGRALADDPVYRLQADQIIIRIAELQSAIDALERVVHLAIDQQFVGLGEGLITRFMVLFGLGVLVGGALWWLVLSRILRPLSDLAVVIHRIRNGEQALRPRRWAEDELGAVVDAFNDLIDRRQEAERELADYQHQLEAKVEARTEALERSRQDAESLRRQAEAALVGVEAANAQLSREVKVRKKSEQTLRENEARLHQAVLAADAANQAKSTFLANMSHELRTPLNAVLGFSQLMQQNPALPALERDHLSIINHSGHHLLNLINEVLDMSKIEAGRMRLEERPFDLYALINEVVGMMRPRAEEKGLVLHLEQAEGVPQYLCTDPAKLRQVLLNLLGNGLKFTEHGQVTLSVSAEAQAETTLLVLVVEDSGAGIAEQELGRLFQPFEQLGLPSEQRGTGLGLAISKQFVEMMGGTISATSRLGLGTRIRVEMAVQVVAEEVTLPVLDGGRVLGLQPGQPEYRLLIVEDQAENRLLLKTLLERVGLTTCEASSGEQAIALFTQWQPQLIWMDQRMPGMDGLEATRRIRALPGGEAVKIVAITASAFTEERARILAAGMDGYISKPFRIEEIFASLEQLLGVAFIYQPLTTPTAEPLAEADAIARLAQLPEALRGDLAAALVSLDVPRCGELVEEIMQEDAELAASLRRRIDGFEFEALIGWMEQGGAAPGS